MRYLIEGVTIESENDIAEIIRQNREIFKNNVELKDQNTRNELELKKRQELINTQSNQLKTRNQEVSALKRMLNDQDADVWLEAFKSYMRSPRPTNGSATEWADKTLEAYKKRFR